MRLQKYNEILKKKHNKYYIRKFVHFQEELSKCQLKDEMKCGSIVKSTPWSPKLAVQGKKIARWRHILRCIDRDINIPENLMSIFPNEVEADNLVRENVITHLKEAWKDYKNIKINAREIRDVHLDMYLKIRHIHSIQKRGVQKVITGYEGNF